MMRRDLVPGFVMQNGVIVGVYVPCQCGGSHGTVIPLKNVPMNAIVTIIHFEEAGISRPKDARHFSMNYN